MAKRQKVAVVTLGCSKNTVDSERLQRQITANRFSLVEDPGEADTVIVNTCGFIEAAKQESVNTILQSVGLKNAGNIKKIIVAGCLSERYADDLRQEIPEVDAFFGTENYEGIINEIGGELKYELLGERVLSGPSHTAYLKISEGCDNPCSFCAIPLMRGLHRSKPIEELVREAEFLAANHARELVIIGQDTTDYGKDLYGRRALADLLNRLSEVKGIAWIRLMYAYPSHFPEEVMDVLANNPKVCAYIDIPLQHISETVLKSMRRGISRRRTIELLNRLREKVPGITIRTTFIVGYPAEGEEEFRELFDFVKDFQFDRLGVFTYSVEERTPAFILGDTVPDKVKQARKDKLMKLQSAVALAKNQNKIGSVIEVLIEGHEGGFWVGRSRADAPEVDGEVLIPVGTTRLKPGRLLRAEVYDCNEYDLFAKVIE